MKKYRFIGNMEDVTPCGNMDEECIAVGCKGKVWGQCHFDPKLNLLSSGSECYEEVRDTVRCVWVRVLTGETKVIYTNR